MILASLFFYSYWNISYLPLILLSFFVNYTISSSFLKINKKINKKTVLSIGILFNIFLLGYFKYADFFIENINYTFGLNIEELNLLLPLAISFFTFQQIAYLVDSYQGKTKEYSFLNYTLFVTFFPQLIAGPIVHHKEMLPQFGRVKNLIKNYENIAKGIFIFSIGLFEGWGTSLSYTFQLYFDFSGYTDMAIGIALLFNIILPINFNSPYKSLNIQEFWRRWHITLSNFLRDDIYIPLGGSKVTSYRIYSNLMITFLIGGLWHGAGWTFIFWGFLHGFALIIHRVWKNLNITISKFFAWVITFNFINITWVFLGLKILSKH